MSMFHNVPQAPADPLFSLNEEFKQDTRSCALNLALGVYVNQEGICPVLPSVKKAEELLLHNEKSKTYLSIKGDSDYVYFGTRNLLPKLSQRDFLSQFVHAQTPGGTAALSLCGKLIQSFTDKTLYLPTPTWANHNKIFKACSCPLDQYSYIHKDTFTLDLSGILEALTSCENSVFLFHMCCQNPTGVDPNNAEWKQIIQAAKQHGHCIVFDAAYHGFKEGLEEDAFPVQYAEEQNLEYALAYSYSKSMGLYAERTGFLLVKTFDEATKNNLQGQLNILIRTNYSNPPKHGAFISKTILEDPALTKAWTEDLKVMRLHLKDMRKKFAQMIQERNIDLKNKNFAEQNGMFSLLGIEKEVVNVLKDKHAIYMPLSGRVNFASLNDSTLETFVNALENSALLRRN